MLRFLIVELRAPLTRPMDVLNPLVFMVLAVMLFAIALPDPEPEISVALLWVIVLLTVQLSTDGLFRRAYENGQLEQFLIAAEVPFLAVLVRVLVQWIYSGLVLVVLSPLLGLSLGVPADALDELALSLLLGTPALTLLGAIGAGLTVGIGRAGIILGLLVLPLFVPVLIFGVAAAQAPLDGGGTGAQFYWLTFISMVALLIGPFATLAGLRISVQL